MQTTKIRVAPHAHDEEVASPGSSAARHALDDARSVLPWRDLGVPARGRLALYVLLTPVAVLLVRLLAPSLLDLTEPGALVATAVVSFLLPFFFPSAAAFGVSLAFHALGGTGTKGRLRQALVCPYCRDGVEREGTVICARAKCGALYHRAVMREQRTEACKARLLLA